MRNVGRLNASVGLRPENTNRKLDALNQHISGRVDHIGANHGKLAKEHEVEDDGAVRTVPGHSMRLPNYCMHNGGHYIRKD